MGAHLINGEFQSDKYPTCPRGKVPLSVKDKDAQDLLWEYAQRHRARDPEFSVDLEQALLRAGYKPPLQYEILAFADLLESEKASHTDAANWILDVAEQIRKSLPKPHVHYCDRSRGDRWLCAAPCEAYRLVSDGPDGPWHMPASEG